MTATDTHERKKKNWGENTNGGTTDHYTLLTSTGRQQAVMFGPKQVIKAYYYLYDTLCHLNKSSF